MPDWITAAVGPLLLAEVGADEARAWLYVLGQAITGVGLAFMATGVLWKWWGREHISGNGITRRALTIFGWIIAIAGLVLERVGGGTWLTWGLVGLLSLLVGVIWNVIKELRGASNNLFPLGIATLGWVAAVLGTASAWEENYGIGLVFSCIVGYGGGFAILLWLTVKITQPGADKRQRKREQRAGTN